MKRRLFIISCLLTTVSFLSANTDKFETILTQSEKKIVQVNLFDTENKVFLRTAFSNFRLINPKDYLKIKGKVITNIQLVYSENADSSFNQIKLNYKRLIALNKLDSNLFNNPTIKWELVVQSGNTLYQKPNELFHGFIITYRPNPSKEEEIKNLLSSLGVNDDTPAKTDVNKKNNSIPIFKGGDSALNNYISQELKYPDKALSSKTGGKVTVGFLVKANGEISDAYIIKGTDNEDCNREALRLIRSMPPWNPARVKGVAIDFISSLTISFNRNGMTETQEISHGLKNSFYNTDTLSEKNTVCSKSGNKRSFLRDSTIFKIFKRNSSWTNMTVIADLTGSMSPYTAELLIWFQLSLKETSKRKISSFTFFNDGDSTLDREKIIGNTGGIYIEKAKTFEDVKNLAVKTILGGNGGDTPENNIESILKTIELNPNCKNIVMIADNYATPKDMELLKQIDKPIKIILCGVVDNINPAYLKIARDTKGSVHTMQEDLTDLINLNEGETITIGKTKYVIIKGAFVKIYSS
jgi:TonB family protein